MAEKELFMEDKRNKLAFINLLKFFAALSIAIVLHYKDHFYPYSVNMIDGGASYPFNNLLLGFIAKYGNVFAEFYFVVSGVFFAIMYERKIQESELSFSSFMRRRVIRIFPLMIVTSIVAFLGNLILYKKTALLWSCGSLNIWYLIRDIVFGGKSITGGAFTNNAPIWYIGVLTYLYIVAFFLAKLRKKLGGGLIIYMIPIAIGVRYFGYGNYFLCWDYHLARGYIAFFAGIICGHFLLFSDSFSDRVKYLISVVFLLEVIFILYISTSHYQTYFFERDHYNLVYSLLVWPEVICIGYLIPFISKMCDNKFVSTLGGMSYGIYLWNFPIFIALYFVYIALGIHFQINSFLFFCVLTLIHLILSFISHIVFDKKLIPLLNGLVGDNIT